MEDNKNIMRAINIEKVVINMGTGSDESINKNAKNLIEIITNSKPVSTLSKKRNPAFKVSKGQRIGAMVTIRGKNAETLANRLLDAVDNKLKESNIMNNTVNFGIKEYIDISKVKYDPKIGMLGLNVNITFKRKGARVEQRKRKQSKISMKHKMIKKEEIIDFMKKRFNTEIV
ncbi:MAG: 50S ribosomal protein L5 [Candidatus Marsarchaeota archaeon]|jgi:large subunit ribosomal protein L5|nr:50S ribosomal protein L5 [Candidatus Marsarchaeota archaeon]